MPNSAWSEKRLITELAQALCASGLSYLELERRTKIASHYLKELVKHGRIDWMRWPEDLRSLCRVLNLSADDLLGLQEQNDG